MELNWFESIIFGLVSGLTEILPVSAPAHEALICSVFGMPDHPLLRLLIHASVWAALYVSINRHLMRMFQANRLSKIPPKRRQRQPDPILLRELKLFKTTFVVVILGFFVAYFMRDIKLDLSHIALLLVVNGIILYIPGHLSQGNKDSRSMSPMDGILIGLGAALAMIPGISRIGAAVSVAGSRGAGKEHALRWALLLNLAALLVVVGYDFYAVITTGLSLISFATVICCLLAGVAAFSGAIAGIRIMEHLAFQIGFSGFAYYSWGAALFAFLIYLTI